jgi:CRISPR-associated endoribonuclease Cas6/Csy4 subtype I-F
MSEIRASELHVVRIVVHPVADEDGRIPRIEVGVGRLLTHVHRACDGQAFSVAFPKYCSGIGRTLGDTVLLFAEGAPGLASLLEDRRVKAVLRERCHADAIAPVEPTDVLGWVKFSRDLSNHAARPAALRRAERRFDAGVRRTRPTQPRFVDQGLPWYRHTSLESARRGDTMIEVPIFVRAESLEGPGQGGFNSLGLSKGSAVPVLRSMLVSGSVRSGVAALAGALEVGPARDRLQMLEGIDVNES